MKLHQLPRPLLLVCAGLPGAGKSAFARQLAASQHVAWIHGNRLRHLLFDSPQFSPQEEALVGDLAHYMLSEAVATKTPLIFDAAANTKATRQRLHKLAADAGYHMLVVWVQTDAATAFSRAKRDQKDEFSPALSREQFEAQVAQFQAPDHTETSVVISGKHTFTTQQRTLSSKLEQLMRPSPKITKSGKNSHALAAKNLTPLSDVHHPTEPVEPQRSNPRFHLTRRIKFR